MVAVGWIVPAVNAPILTVTVTESGVKQPVESNATNKTSLRKVMFLENLIKTYRRYKGFKQILS